jgi:hypothetical protein
LYALIIGFRTNSLLVETSVKLTLYAPMLYWSGARHWEQALLCGIIDEMSALIRLRDKSATTPLSFFFCQATNSRINNAAAVLHGLIYLLINQ